MTRPVAPGAVGVVVVAAGRGDRLGGDEPKALVAVAGVPLVVHALGRLERAGLPPAVVVHPPGDESAFAAALTDREVLALVEGGATRTDSVRRGVGALGDVEVVLVHDAARAFTPPEMIRRVLRAVGPGVLAAAPARPVPDTLKRVDGEGTVLGTVDRDGLVGVQTPQAFPHEVLLRALALGDDATDELALVERLVASGDLEGRVVTVAGSALALKVTFPDDLAVAERLAGSRA